MDWSAGWANWRLSNLNLHYVLDLWFARVVKGRLRDKAQPVRYIDDFVICFQYRSDAIRVQDALRLRLGKFGLTLEPPRPNWSSLVGSRRNTRANAAGTARYLSTFWA